MPQPDLLDTLHRRGREICDIYLYHHNLHWNVPRWVANRLRHHVHGTEALRGRLEQMLLTPSSRSWHGQRHLTDCTADVRHNIGRVAKAARISWEMELSTSLYARAFSDPAINPDFTGMREGSPHITLNNERDLEYLKKTLRNKYILAQATNGTSRLVTGDSIRNRELVTTLILQDLLRLETHVNEYDVDDDEVLLMHLARTCHPETWAHATDKTAAFISTHMPTYQWRNAVRVLRQPELEGLVTSNTDNAIVRMLFI